VGSIFADNRVSATGPRVHGIQEALVFEVAVPDAGERPDVPPQTYAFNVTDMYVNLGSGNATVGAGSTGAPLVLDSINQSPAASPLKSITIAVKDQTAGNHTGYDIRASVNG
jgi:hypothetical protein